MINFDLKRYLEYYERNWDPESEGFQKIQTSNGRHYWFRPGHHNPKVLVVAHHDTVTPHHHAESPQIERVEVETNDGNKRMLTKISNAPHDDRQGIATALYTLPLFGITQYDVLITTDEEIGSSTAAFFETSKQYNWIMQFDRAGSFSDWSGASYDVALYQYSANAAWKSAVEASFGASSNGSFTDICYLGHLGCAAMNVAAYHDSHSKSSYMLLEYYLFRVAQAARFFYRNYHKHFGYSVGTSDNRALYLREPDKRPKPKVHTNPPKDSDRQVNSLLSRYYAVKDVLGVGLNVSQSFRNLFKGENSCAFCDNSSDDLWDLYDDKFLADFSVCGECLKVVTTLIETRLIEVEIIEDEKIKEDDDEAVEVCCCCGGEMSVQEIYGYIAVNGNLDYVCSRPDCLETAAIVGNVVKFATYNSEK